MGASSANRRPTRRTSAWSLWMDGSAIRFSSSAYSCRRADSRSLLIFSPDMQTTPDPGGPGRAPSRRLLLLAGVDLGVLGLELRDPARGVEDALLADVERVAGAAGLDVDLTVLGGAARGEGAAAGTDGLGGRVLRVNVGLHVVRSSRGMVAGSPSALAARVG